MCMKPVTTCCCGCSLKTGSTIIGCIYLMVSTVFLGVAIYFVSDLNLESPKESNQDDINSTERIYFVILVIFFGVECTLAVMLLLGIYQIEAKLVRMWAHLNVVATLTFGIFTTVFSPIPGSRVMILVLYGFTWYTRNVVLSFYQEMCNSPDQVTALSNMA